MNLTADRVSLESFAAFLPKQPKLTGLVSLQAKIGGQWKTFYTGKTIGEECRVKFEPVKAQVFRLNIVEATEGPPVLGQQMSGCGFQKSGIGEERIG